MKRILSLLALAFLFATPAFAQNTTCATRPLTDSSNACASTAFVSGSLLTNITANMVHSGTFTGTYVFSGTQTITPTNWGSGGSVAQLILGGSPNAVGSVFGGPSFLNGFNGVTLGYGSGSTVGLILDPAGLVTVNALTIRSGGVTINPPQNTANAAITTFQVPGSSSLPPTQPWLNLLEIANDNMNFGADAFFAPWTFSYFFGGTNMTGARTQISMQTTMTAASSTSNRNHQYNTLGVTFFANASDGGTGLTLGTAQGATGSINPIVIAGPAAQNMFVINAMEVDTSIQTGGSAYYKGGIASVLAYASNVRGAVYDAAFIVGKAADSTSTWKYGYSFFDVHGSNPLGPDSIAMGSIGTTVIGSFFDFPNYSCSGNIIRINTVYAVDCTGALTAGNVSVAHIAATGTPSSSTFLRGDGSWQTVTGTGTVTSFSAGNLSPLFTTSVATATTTPALTFSLTSAAANLVFASPNGGAGAGLYRALVAADIPALATLTFGTHLTGTSYNTSTGVTIATDAASANTVSTIVARDGSGNFTAGTISAALTGHASLDCALGGCTMSGAIAMGGNNITGAGTVAATNYTGTFAGNTWTTGTGTLTITAAKTLSISNTLTFAGTDGSTLNVGAGGTLGTAAFVNTGTSGGTVPLLNAANTFSADQRFNNNILVASTTEKVWNAGSTTIVVEAGSTVFLRAASTNVLSVNSTSATIASGLALRLPTAFVTTAPAATGTITMQDNTGTSYRFLVAP